MQRVKKKKKRVSGADEEKQTDWTSWMPHFIWMIPVILPCERIESFRTRLQTTSLLWTGHARLPLCSGKRGLNLNISKPKPTNPASTAVLGRMPRPRLWRRCKALGLGEMASLAD